MITHTAPLHFNPSCLSPTLIRAARRRYNIDADIRTYHNMDHAIAVHNALFKLGNPSMAAQLAALYHDAVYVPGAATGANEQCSAAVLRLDWVLLGKEQGTGISEGCITAAMLYIQNTSVDVHLSTDRVDSTSDLAMLLDADLSALAADWSVFEQNQAHIISENDGEPTNPSARKLSALFLSKLLTVRPDIYHTDAARQLWECPANSNIHKWMTLNAM